MKNCITIEKEIKVKTNRAVMVEDCGEEIWIPLSMILESDPERDEMKAGEEATFTIPKWLARDKGLVE